MNRQQRRRHGKSNGMSYADQLAMKRTRIEATRAAANDAMVQIKADIHVQRVMWLMCVAMNDAFGIGPERFERFADKLQERSEWYEQMVKGADEEYANEKLRQEAQRISGIKIEYLYEAEMREAQRKYENDPEVQKIMEALNGSK